MYHPRTLLLLLATLAATPAQEIIRTKDVRDIGKRGTGAIPQLRELLKNPVEEVRLEAVKQLVEIGTAASLDPLTEATRDNSAEIQTRAVNGIVNFYLPGYVRGGITGKIRKAGTVIKSQYTDTNDQVIEPYVQVAAPIASALGALVRGAASLDARANAARASGILRLRPVVPDLVQATRSKNSNLIYESLIAIQKIRDTAAGSEIVYLVKDFDPRVQSAAIETVGLLRTASAVQPLTDVLLNRARDNQTRRAALGALAQIADPGSRQLFSRYLADKDDGLRGAAAEGLGRLKNPADLAALDKAFKDESKTSPRLSLAFALVAVGRREAGQFSPLQYLVNNLNLTAWKDVALPLLTDLARDANVRTALADRLAGATKDEKIGIARALGASGDRDTLPVLQKLQSDGDVEVSREAVNAVRALQMRL